MAFNNRKFQKLMEAEKQNTLDFVDEFEDDFDDDFDDAEDVVEEQPAPVTEFEPEPQPEPEPEPQPEPEPEPQPEPEPEPQPEPEPEPEPEIVFAAVEEPVKEEYDPNKMWQDMAALAIKAKESINAGAFFRANDIVAVMRSMLVEMMCRKNGIEDNFNENADNLSDECKQDIYTSYAAVLNAQSLYNAVTNIMAVTYKYI